MPNVADTAFVEIVPDMRNFSRQLGQDLKSQSRRLSRSMGQPLQNAADQAGERGGRQLGRSFLSGVRRAAIAGGGIAAAIGIGRLGAAVAQSATGLQDAQATLSGLLGSTEQATDTIRRLREVASQSPIEQQAFLDAGNALAYMGIQGEQAQGILSNVADAITAAGGSSEQMGTVSEAMLQMVNTGKVYTEQLNRISDAGVPIFSGLAAHFDTNIANVREMVESGKIGIEDVLGTIEQAEGETFQSMLAASDKASQTFSNQWKIAKDNIITTLGELLLPVIERLTPVMQNVVAAIPAVGESIRSAFSGAGEALSTIREPMTVVAGVIRNDILPVLAQWGRLLVNEVWPALLDVGRALMSVVMPPIRQFAEFVVGSVIPAVSRLGNMIIGAIGPALRALAGFLRENRALLEVLAAGLLGAIVAMRVWRGVVILANGAMRAYAVVQRLVNAAMSANPIAKVVALLGFLVGAIIYAWKNNETFRKVVIAVWNAVRDAIGAAATWINKNVIRPMVTWFRTLWQRAREMGRFVRNAFRLLGRALSRAASWINRNVIEPIVTWFGVVRDRADNLRDRAVAAWDGMRRGLRRAAVWIKNNVIDPVRNFFQSVVTKADDIRGAVIRTFHKMRRGIKNAWDRVTGVIKSPIRSALNFLNTWVIDKINWVIGKFGVPDIPNIPTNFNKGGLVPGVGNRDTVPAMLTPQEGVITARRMADLSRQMGMSRTQTIDAINSGRLNPSTANMAAQGTPVDLGVGGPLDVLGDAWDAIKTVPGAIPGWAKGVTDVAGLGAEWLMKRAMNPAIDAFSGRISGAPLLQDTFDGALRFIRDKAVAWAVGKDNQASELGVGRVTDLGALQPGGWIRPLSNYVVTRGSAGHGYNSIDLAAPIGTAVAAAKSGVVSSVQRLFTSYGHHIRVNHGGGFQSLYAHLSRILVGVGERVRAGTKIGEVGSTGNSTGPHLHWEVLRNGARLEPTNYVKFDQTAGGVLPRGLSYAYNGTGGPERMVPADGGSGFTINVNVPNGWVGSHRDLQNMLVGTLTDLNRKGRLNGIKTLAGSR